MNSSRNPKAQKAIKYCVWELHSDEHFNYLWSGWVLKGEAV